MRGDHARCEPDQPRASRAGVHAALRAGARGSGDARSRWLRAGIHARCHRGHARRRRSPSSTPWALPMPASLATSCAPACSQARGCRDWSPTAWCATLPACSRDRACRCGAAACGGAAIAGAVSPSSAWQQPIGCGGVAVFPDDVIVADGDGAVHHTRRRSSTRWWPMRQRAGAAGSLDPARGRKRTSGAAGTVSAERRQPGAPCRHAGRSGRRPSPAQRRPGRMPRPSVSRLATPRAAQAALAEQAGPVRNMRVMSLMGRGGLKR